MFKLKWASSDFVNTLTRSILNVLVLSCIFFFVPETEASNNSHKTLVLHASNNTDINEYTYAYHDQSEGASSVEKIIALPDNSWNQPTKKSPNFGFTKDHYWFKLTIKNSDALANKKYYYQINSPVMDYISFYLLSDNKVEAEYHTGDKLVYDTRPIQSNTFVFPITVGPASEKTILIRLQTEGTLALPAYLYSEQEFLNRSLKFFIMQGFYFGIVGIMLFYNLSLFFAFRTREYLTYVLYGVSVITVQSTMHGFSFQFIWPESVWWNNKAIPASILCSAVFMMLFTCDYLSLHVHRKRLTHVLRGVSAFFIVVAIASVFIPYSISMKLAGLSVLLIMPLCVGTAILSYRKNKKLVMQYLFAWSVMFVGSITLVLSKFGLIHEGLITSNGWQIGTGLEIVIFSFALSFKIKTINDDKHLAEDEARVANERALNEAALTRVSQQESIDNLKKYEKLYEESIEGRFQLTPRDQKIKCNQALADIFGYESVNELINDESFLRTAGEEVYKYITRMLRDKRQITNQEISFKHRLTGLDTWVSLNIRVLRKTQDEELEIEASLIDITQRKLKESAVKEKDIVEAKNAAKTQFFASMSHEFRTPLTAILGYSELAVDKSLDDRERISHVKTIGHSAEHMLQLINDVLDLAKIEAQKLDVESIPVDLYQISQQIRDFIWILASQKEISFDIEYQYPLPKVFISDPTRLKQALINLCSNSIKFTEKGGVILRISCHPDSEQLFFAVEDTGIGLKQEQLQNLFKAFAQADKTTSRNFGGTGLGLHLSKLIANKLGGDISVDSEFGNGSTFTLSASTGSLNDATWVDEFEVKPIHIEMEVLPDDDEPVSCILKSSEPSERITKIILAEDNVVNQKLISFHVKRAGAEVIIANDGLEAIAAVLRDDADMVLMDMDMPNMDGLTAVSYLRTKGFSLPIVALSGNIDEESVKLCMEAGCTGHLAKPLDLDKLNSVIESLNAEIDEAASSVIAAKDNQFTDDRLH